MSERYSFLCQIIGALAFALLGFTDGGFPQQTPQPRLSIRLSRSAFEVGIRYTEPIASVTVACAAKDLGATADWGDGNPIEMLSHAVRLDGGQAGSNDLFSEHMYTHSGPFKVKLESFATCIEAGRSMKISDERKFEAAAFDRVAVKEFTSASDTVNRGNPLKLKITLVQPAPTSGTRISLLTDKPDGVFQENSFPKYVQIPESSTQISIQIPVLPTAMTGPVKIAALSGGKPLGLSVQVR